MSVKPVVHIEIPSNNHQQAKSFYTQLCGWSVNEIPFSDNEVYISFGTGGVDVALSTMDDHNQAGDVLIYFHSDDIDADIAKVVELGGSVVLPRQIVEGFGAFAIFLDPMGNRVAFWQNTVPS